MDPQKAVMNEIYFIEPSGERATLLGMYFGIGAQMNYMPATRDQGYMGRVHLQPDRFKAVTTPSTRLTSDLYRGNMGSTYQPSSGAQSYNSVSYN